MEQKQRNYVQDLKAWDLLRLEEFEIKLVDDLMAATPRVTYFDREHLGEDLHAQFLDRLRDLAGTAVIETIDYWMKGLADGNDGEFPEFCLVFAGAILRAHQRGRRGRRRLVRAHRLAAVRRARDVPGDRVIAMEDMKRTRT